MLGSNPVRKQELGDGQRLWIQEIFDTVQGEGPFVGMPCVFIRLGGCNLTCQWCDTDFESSTWTPSIEEAVSKVSAIMPARSQLVIITGGEPLRQNIVPLLTELTSRGYRAQIETNGTYWIEDLEHFCKRGTVSLVCSPKTGKVHPNVAYWAEAWKYIIRDGEVDLTDGLPNVLASTGRPGKVHRPPPGFDRAYTYVQPCDDQDPDKNLKNLQATLKSSWVFGYRLCIQVHKMIGLP